MFQWMLNLSIIKKMALLVGTLLVLLVGVAGYSVFKMNLVAKEVSMIAHENMPLIKMSSTVVIKQLESEIALEKAFRAAELHSSEEQSVEQYLQSAVALHREINQEIKSSEQLLAKADQLAATEDDKVRFRALEPGDVCYRKGPPNVLRQCGAFRAAICARRIGEGVGRPVRNVRKSTKAT